LALPSSRCSERRGSFRILVAGESGKGKTTLTEKAALALAAAAGPERVAVLDFAPGFGRVGRRIEAVPAGARLIRPEPLYAPRLMGKTCSEVWELARKNAEKTTEALRKYLEKPEPVLVANDLSIHLHAGDLSLLLEAISAAALFFGNAYYGTSLKDECGVWEREKELVEKLMEEMDLVWLL